MNKFVTKLIIKLGVLLAICSHSVLLQAAGFDQFKLDMLLAQRGDSGAQFYVASAYEEGRGVAKDLTKAFEWYNKAAANKHNGAQFKVGECYANGWGVLKNP
ncbi:MAG: sel1 repeat family protein, partial [Gammaproteobacteria bacterium]|nr:sel1 repeat family protein [Gammaproteobacteria bacterium]